MYRPDMQFDNYWFIGRDGHSTLEYKALQIPFVKRTGGAINLGVQVSQRCYCCPNIVRLLNVDINVAIGSQRRVRVVSSEPSAFDDPIYHTMRIECADNAILD